MGIGNCFGKSFFDEIVGIPLGGKVKPDPEAFVEKVLVPYRLDPTRLAYFGDSVTDVVTARNLRIREIYAVSCDTHFVHKAWHDASERIQKIQYPMLADPTHCLSKDFEVYIEADGLAERGSFIVNPEGKIVAYEVNAGNVGRNADELLRKVQACQFVAEHGDEVCPAKWQPGAETLKPSLDLVGQL